MKKYFFIAAFLFLAILSNAQNFIWAKTIGGGGSSGSSSTNSMKMDASGNVYVAGSFNSTCYFNLPSATPYSLAAVAGGAYDFFIAKYDNAGNFIWASKMGGQYGDNAYALDLDAAGNIYVTGTFSGTADFNPGTATNNLTTPDQSIFIAKYDNNGNYIWAKKIDGPALEQPSEIRSDVTGNIYLTGSYAAGTDFDPSAATATVTGYGYDDFFIAKYDNAGNYVWAKGIGGANADECYALNLDASSNIYITGYIGGVNVDFDPGPGSAYIINSGQQDIFIAKYDNNGNYIWAKDIGGTGNTSYNSAYALKTDATGNIYIGGSFGGIVDFDPSAATYTMVSPSGNTGFLAKYNTNGNLIWAENIGGLAFGIDLSSTGTIYTTGYFSGTKDFDPSINVVNLVSSGYGDIFISAYDNNGNYLLVKKMGAAGHEVGVSIKLDAMNNIYLAGYYQFGCDFDPGPGSFQLNAYGGQDVFIAKYSDITIGIHTNHLTANALKIYPNPFTNKTVVSFELAAASEVEINLYDALGQRISIIESKHVDNGDHSFEISAPAKGIYFLQAIVNGISTTRKIVKAE